MNLGLAIWFKIIPTRFVFQLWRRGGAEVTNTKNKFVTQVMAVASNYHPAYDSIETQDTVSIHKTRRIESMGDDSLGSVSNARPIRAQHAGRGQQ